jgi:hypothetical protein
MDGHEAFPYDFDDKGDSNQFLKTVAFIKAASSLIVSSFPRACIKNGQTAESSKAFRFGIHDVEQSKRLFGCMPASFIRVHLEHCKLVGVRASVNRDG